MKIAVLSRNPRLYSTRRLVEAGQQRGHEMVVIDTLRAYMNIASHKPQIHYRGRPLEGFDAVIPRIGASVTFYGCAVLRQFEMMGVFPLNESVAIARSLSSSPATSTAKSSSALRASSAQVAWRLLIYFFIGRAPPPFGFAGRWPRTAGRRPGCLQRPAPP